MSQSNGESREPGLDPRQERAAYMLATGMGVQEVADELDIHRSTLWEWRQQAPFRAFYNRLLAEIKADVKEGLVGLYEEAIDTVRECLNSEDERVALKAATRVIERVDDLRPGETDPREILRKKHSTSGFDDMLPDGSFDQEEYEKECRKLDIEPM